jgi:hypothetical protein
MARATSGQNLRKANDVSPLEATAKKSGAGFSERTSDELFKGPPFTNSLLALRPPSTLPSASN